MTFHRSKLRTLSYRLAGALTLFGASLGASTSAMATAMIDFSGFAPTLGRDGACRAEAFSTETRFEYSDVSVIGVIDEGDGNDRVRFYLIDSANTILSSQLEIAPVGNANNVESGFLPVREDPSGAPFSIVVADFTDGDPTPPNGSTFSLPILARHDFDPSLLDSDCPSVGPADTTPPAAQSITLNGSPALNDETIDFTVTFDESANNITTDDFFVATVSGTASGTVAGVSAASGAAVTVTVNAISGTGSLRLDLNAATDIADDAGNGGGTNGFTAAFTGGDTHTVDRDTPPAPSTPDLQAASDTGVSNSDNITASATPTFSGTGETGAFLMLFRDDNDNGAVDGGEILGSTTVSGGGWTIQSSALPDGVYNIRALQSDSANNTSTASDSLTVTIDTTAPAAPSLPDIPAGSDTGVSNTDNVTQTTALAFSGSGETGASVVLFRDDNGNGTPESGESLGSTAAAGGAWTINPGALAEGTYDIRAIQTDLAGNVSAASSTLALTIDTTAPGAASAPDLAASSDTGVSNTDNITSDTTPTFDGSAEADVRVTVTSSLDGDLGTVSADSGGDWTLTPGAPLQAGTHEITAVAEDLAGNRAPPSPALSMTIETGTPSVAISSTAGDQVTGAFAITVTFSTAVNGFDLNDLAVGNGAASNLSGSGAVYTADITPAGDGAVTVDIASGAARDNAGNDSAAAAQFSVTADLTAPGVVSVFVSDQTLTIADVGSEFTVAVTFSEQLDTGAAPAIDFAGGADLSGTLIFQSGAFSDGDTVYTARYTIADGGLGADDVGVGVSGGRDLFGNAVAASTADDLFDVDMRRASVTVAVNVQGRIDGAFDFSGDLSTFSIATASQQGQRAFTDLTEGAYRIAIADRAGFTASDVSCSGAAFTPNGNNEVTVTVNPAETATCSFSLIADPVIDSAVIEEVNLALPSDTSDLLDRTAPVPLNNLGGAPLRFEATASVDWLRVTPASGVVPPSGETNIAIGFTRTVLDLPPGTYNGVVSVRNLESGGAPASGVSPSSAGGQIIEIPVTVAVAGREGSLTIISTTVPAQAGDASFRYAASIEAFDGLELTTSGGVARRGPVTLDAGAYAVTQTAPEGWRLDSIQCAGGEASVDTAAGRLDVTLGADEAVVCTFANVRDEDYVRRITQTAIRSFMAARADRIVSASPNLTNRLRSGRSGAGSFRAEASEGQRNASFAASLSGMRANGGRTRATPIVSVDDVWGAGLAGAGETLTEYDALRYGAPPRLQHAAYAVPLSSAGVQSAQPDRATRAAPARTSDAPEPAPFDLWIEARYADITDDRAGQANKSTFGLIYLGADYLINQDLMVGALFQYDIMDSVAGELRSEVDGTGWMAGPYMAARLRDSLFFSARAAWGRSDNEINPLGLYTDEFDTTRWLIEGTLVGDYRAGALRISPELGLIYFEEDQKAYVDSLGVDIPGQSLTLGRLRAGPEIAYRFEHGENGFTEPYARLMLNWDYDNADVLNAGGVLESLDELRADAALGANAHLDNGMMLGTEIGFSGIGAGDFDAVSARFQLTIPFSGP